jgi:hypothetical protein
MIEKPVFKLTIPEWKNKVGIGIIAPKYYKAHNKVPDKIRDLYKVKKVFGDFYYVDDKGKRVKQGTRNVGEEKMWRINGQAFYSNTLHWRTRASIVKEYHMYIKEFIIKEFEDPFPTFLGFSLKMHVEIYEVYSAKMPDITNMWILPKMIEDTFVKAKILREDAPEFRRETSFGYSFVTEKEKRKLVITFKYQKNV